MENFEKIENKEQSSFESKPGPILLDQRIKDLIIKYDLVNESPNNDVENYKEIYNSKLSETQQKENSIDLIKSSKYRLHQSSVSFYSKDGSLRLSDHWYSRNGKMKTNFDYKYGEIVLAKLNYETYVWEKVESIDAYRVEPWQQVEQNKILNKRLEKTFALLSEKFLGLESDMTTEEAKKFKNLFLKEETDNRSYVKWAIGKIDSFLYFRELSKDHNLRKDEESEGFFYSDVFFNHVEEVCKELESQYGISLEDLIEKLKKEDMDEKRTSYS